MYYFILNEKVVAPYGNLAHGSELQLARSKAASARPQVNWIQTNVPFVYDSTASIYL